MWKLLIAEDETPIRKGLRHAVNWEDYDIVDIVEAEDGEMALEIAKKEQPDILFVDINMPFLNGLELMNQLKQQLQGSIFIVITGYDEFNYAQQAVKIGAFDYLLKPVKREELVHSVKKATEQLQKIRASGERDVLLEGNKQLLKERFFQNWCLGLHTDEEISKQCQLLNIRFQGRIGIVVLKVIRDIDVSMDESPWEDVLVAFALKNIVRDVVNDPDGELFEDQMGATILLIPNTDWEQLLITTREIKANAEKFLGKVVLSMETVIPGIADLPYAYKQSINGMDMERNLSPMVVLAKNYIDQHYFNHGLSLQEVADNAQISPTYLSKQIKNELGVSFIQYLTKLRVKKALMLMQDPYLKIYEVAEMVGYSTQHYFSSAFKKVVGISPTVYRDGVKSNV